MDDFISVATIIVAIFLIITLLLQVRGTSAGLFGGGGSSFRTRRGIEKTLLQFTIMLAVILITLSIIAVRL